MPGPLVTSALVSAGGSLLGGLFGRNRPDPKYVGPSPRRTRKQNKAAVVGNIAGVRAAARAYGFNPLALLGTQGQIGSGSVVQSEGSSMGKAIADAAMFLGDGLAAQSNADAAGELEKARLENDELRKKVVSMTIRPKVGGIYAGNVSTPTTVSGPRPLVKVIDAMTNEWTTIPPGVADRLGLKDGDTWIAEDREAVLGDLLSEADNLAGVVKGAWSGGLRTPENPYPGSRSRPKLSKPKELGFWQKSIRNWSMFGFGG